MYEVSRKFLFLNFKFHIKKSFPYSYMHTSLSHCIITSGSNFFEDEKGRRAIETRRHVNDMYFSEEIPSFTEVELKIHVTIHDSQSHSGPRTRFRFVCTYPQTKYVLEMKASVKIRLLLNIWWKKSHFVCTDSLPLRPLHTSTKWKK